MFKDYKKWHAKKAQINGLARPPFFHEREIWFCYLGANIGFEQDGSKEEFLRPILIIRKFNNEIFWGVPLTKAQKRPKRETDKYYYSFSFLPDITSVAILSQIRLTDAKRLSRHIGAMQENNFTELIKKLKDLFP